MPQKKKRLTQREKDRRAAIKKQLQEEGFLPPNKPRLNRKKFAREVWDEFNAMDTFTGDFYLRRAIVATVGPDMHEVTPEQVGVLKLLKLAVETEKFMKALEAEGRDQVHNRGIPREGLRPGHEFITGGSHHGSSQQENQYRQAVNTTPAQEPEINEVDGETIFHADEEEGDGDE